MYENEFDRCYSVFFLTFLPLGETKAKEVCHQLQHIYTVIGPDDTETRNDILRIDRLSNQAVSINPPNTKLPTGELCQNVGSDEDGFKVDLTLKNFAKTGVESNKLDFFNLFRFDCGGKSLKAGKQTCNAQRGENTLFFGATDTSDPRFIVLHLFSVKFSITITDEFDHSPAAIYEYCTEPAVGQPIHYPTPTHNYVPCPTLPPGPTYDDIYDNTHPLRQEYDPPTYPTYPIQPTYPYSP